MIEKYMREEAMRSRHQAQLLKLRERALIEKTNAGLDLIEQMKRKAVDKSQDDRMPPALLAEKEKGIMSKLRREQADIDRMRLAQRKETANRLGLLAQHAEVVRWCQEKLARINGRSSSRSDSSDVEPPRLDDDDESVSASAANNSTRIENNVLKQVKKTMESEK